MAVNEQPPGADLERRMLPLVTVVPYVLLAVLAGFTALARHGAGRSLLIDLVLCALAALWMVVMFTSHPAWRHRPRVMSVFLAGLLLVALVLAIRNPWFGFFTPACYFYAFRIIGWPAELFFIAGTAVVAGTAQASGLDLGHPAELAAYCAILLVNIVPLCGLAVLLRINERRERQLAAALHDNAELQEQLLDRARTAGVLDERQRLAREIHDTLAQGLTGIITQLQAAAHVAGDPVAWRRHHDSATALARESLTEARRSVHELRPQPLEGSDLPDALALVVATWAQRHDVAVSYETTGTARPLPPAADATLLRTAQEALANVAKHASAGRVGITLSYLDREVALDVRDDGRGFDPDHRLAPDLAGGFGLHAMRQRVEGLAGTLEIESEPGGGTGISARLPLSPRELT